MPWKLPWGLAGLMGYPQWDFSGIPTDPCLAQYGFFKPGPLACLVPCTVSYALNT